jgi:hypothetical protein
MTSSTAVETLTEVRFGVLAVSKRIVGSIEQVVHKGMSRAPNRTWRR